MDDLTKTIIAHNRVKLGALAHQLYLDFVHLGIAQMPNRGYREVYTVRARHLWESDGGVSTEATGASLAEAVQACIAAHQVANHTTTDFQVAWYATLTMQKGIWRRTMAVDPQLYRALVPGGQFDSGMHTATGTPLLASA